MKKALFGVLGCALVLAGCSVAQQAKVVEKLQLACKLDKQYVPLAVNIASLVPVSAVSGLVSVDQLLVHPAVVAACDKLLAGSTPVATVPPPVASPVSLAKAV